MEGKLLMINREGGGSDMKRWISVCLIVCILLILSICYAYAGSNSEHVIKYSSEVRYY